MYKRKIPLNRTLYIDIDGREGRVALGEAISRRFGEAVEVVDFFAGERCGIAEVSLAKVGNRVIDEREMAKTMLQALGASQDGRIVLADCLAVGRWKLYFALRA